MTPKQTSLYWREWGNVRRVLIAAGRIPAEADAQRHRIHIEQLGRDVSSKRLTNAQLDAVLAGFRAYSRPDDLMAQLRLIDQPEQRLEAYKRRAAELADRCGVEEEGRDAYLDSLARRICTRTWETVTETDAAKLCGILEQQAKRCAAKPAPAATPADEEDGNPF